MNPLPAGLRSAWLLGAALLATGCTDQAAAPGASTGAAPQAAAPSAPPPPATTARSQAMSSGLPDASRPPPPEVPPVEWGGVRYQQDLDGAPRQRDQGFGYLQALDAASGRVLWELKVYTVATQPGLETDVQEVYFSRMARVPGQDQLEIENENGQRFVVDVKARGVRPLP